MKKTVRLGTMKSWENGRYMSIYYKIEYENGRFSISGVEGPLPSGNCLGSCGQINMHLKDHQAEIKPAPGWNRAMLTQFFHVWDCWHLNDMKAGTPEQEAELKKHKFPGYPVSYYEWASKVLADAGLNPHNGYVYGSARLKEQVPQSVMDFINTLPETDQKPAWV